MRKIVLLCILLCWVGLPGYGQGQKVAMGFRLGVNMAQLESLGEGGLGSYKIKGGFAGGVFVSYYLNKKFSLQPEIAYSNQGGRAYRPYGIQGNSDYEVYTKQLHYIELPLLLKWQFSPKWYMLTGGSYAHLIGATELVLTAKSRQKMNLKKQYKPVNYFINFGLGTLIPTQTGSFLVDVRLNAGLRNIIDPAVLPNYKERTFSFKVSAGYLFGSRYASGGMAGRVLR
ncbi:porin family protein [Rapidithrix thailandica]|uniref:Porin family protein n=1 Tax=Rapidithrix thailandica TaxID=413964 RepID=A0AAW9S4V4_9BACT